MKVINLKLLLDVLVSWYFIVEEFGICIFLGFWFLIWVCVWCFRQLVDYWKTPTPWECRGMISGSYHLKRNILSRLTKLFLFDFDIEQIQPNPYQDRSNKQSNYDNTFHYIIFLLILNIFKQTMSRQARQKQ